MNWRKQVGDFKADLRVEAPAIRQGDLRIGFFGSIGSGKSVTSQICALAITPAPGLIGIVDGEHGRSGLAVDVTADLAAKKYGGTKEQWKARFKVVHISPPFNPLRVIAASEALKEAGCNTQVLDILTQCWDSSGGYLDLKNDEVNRMVEANRNTTEQRVAQSAAAHIKPWTHQKLVHYVEEFSGNLILCFQAKQKWDAKANKPQENETPIQESGITRTAIAVGKVECRMVDGKPMGGFCVFCGVPGATKHTHDDLLKILPNGEQWTFEHGEKLINWIKTRDGEKAPQPKDPAAALKAKLWKLTASIHGKDMAKLETWLREHKIIGDVETLANLPSGQLPFVIEKAEIVMAEMKGAQ